MPAKAIQSKHDDNESSNPIGDWRDNVWKYELFIRGPAPETEDFELYNDEHWMTLVHCPVDQKAFWGGGAPGMCNTHCNPLGADCEDYIEYQVWQDWALHWYCEEDELDTSCLLESYRPPEQQAIFFGLGETNMYLPFYCGGIF